MSEQRLVDLVRPLTGGEDVLAAGVFQPRGTSGAMAAGEAIGLGGSVADVALGTTQVVAAGHEAAALEGEPRWTILAVTPTRVLAFAGEASGLTWVPGEVYASFDRAHLAVTVHGRLNVRVLVLEDTSDSRTLELETNRVGPQHGKVVVELLAKESAQQD
jgi:hypothetical protein